MENIYELSDIDTIETLKAKGSLCEIKNFLQKEVSPLTFQADNYEALFSIICKLKEKWKGIDSYPFVSKTAEYNYILTKLDGNQRHDLLGITDEMYENKEKAKKWFHEIAQYIHPDKSSDNSSEAFNTLGKIYERMKK